MTPKPRLPRILAIDDLFGRQVAGGRNEDRANICGKFLIEDVTGDEPSTGSMRIKRPVAQAVFSSRADARPRTGGRPRRE